MSVTPDSSASTHARAPRRTTLLVLVAVVATAGAAIAWTRQPSTAPMPVAEVVEIGDGLVYLVFDREAIRIQQPAAIELADLEADGVRVGDEIERVALAPSPTGSRFVMVPPDGPDARLHLLVDDVLHPVIARAGTRADIDGRAEAAVETLTSLVAPR